MRFCCIHGVFSDAVILSVNMAVMAFTVMAVTEEVVVSICQYKMSFQWIYVLTSAVHDVMR